MNNRWLMIKQLDKQLKEWSILNKKYGKPRAGWVKTLRTALNMTTKQLANRLGLKRSRIIQLENAEIHDAVTLRTLRATADAMGCEFIYAIVPKDHTTLESIIKKRAEQIATEKVQKIAHSMALEAQSVEIDALKKQKEALVKNLMAHLNKKFWETTEPQKKNSKEDLLKKLIETLQKKK